MKKHNIHPVILRKHHLGVLVEDGVGEWFKTTVGVRQGETQHTPSHSTKTPPRSIS